jgi:hypothetical protein
VFARQLAMGIVPPGTRLSPRPDWVKPWDSLSADARRLYARQMEVYAAFLEQTDHHIGRVVDFLAQLGELDNTLILLASDNGASAEGGEHGSFNENQFVNRVEPTIPQNLAHLDEWGSVRSFPNYSWGWAWAGNTPLRRWKRYLHQGGMSDPLIVHWPAGIRRARRGARAVRPRGRHRADRPRGARPRGAASLNGVTQRRSKASASRTRSATPRRPTRKDVQYYEMIASRALWADGWKAVVEQPQGAPITERSLARRSGSSTTSPRISPSARTLRTASGQARRAGRAMVGGGREVQRASARLAHAASDGRAQAEHDRCRQSLRLPAGRRAAVRVHGGQREEPLAHDHGGGRDSRRRRRGRAAGARQLVRRVLALREGRAPVYVHNYMGLAEYRIASTEAVPTGRSCCVPVHQHRRAPWSRTRCMRASASSAKARSRTRSRT